MANLASRRETRGDVIGVGCACVLGLVTAVTSRRRSREDIVDVAFAAGRRDVRAGQRELCLGVIECSAGPRTGVMTDLARGRESSGFVIWIGGAVVVRLVAAITVFGHGRVIVIHVAFEARCSLVRACEREPTLRMIER